MRPGIIIGYGQGLWMTGRVAVAVGTHGEVLEVGYEWSLAPERQLGLPVTQRSPACRSRSLPGAGLKI